MEKNISNKVFVFVVIIFFIFGAVMPIISSSIEIQKIDYENLNVSSIKESETKSTLTFYTFDKAGRKHNTVELSSDIASEINDLFKELKYKIVYAPTSKETQESKNNFISLIDEYNLLSEKQSKDEVISILNPKWLELENNVEAGKSKNPLTTSLFTPFSSSFFGTSTFCSISSGGSGMIMPMFMLPRPRAIAFWISNSATAVANLFTGKGFLATGMQSGLLLGFMGIGLTYAIPGYTIYGFIGYTLFAGVAAQDIEFFPPNHAPIISDENPLNNAINVPIELNELSFKILDEDGDLMNYNVTTEPIIGSGADINKKDGIYKVSINGLQSKTTGKMANGALGFERRKLFQ